ncbi:hypothetical protein E3T24_00205 [Cryobacterium sp. TmT2-59]|uniref:hypothetical protein n=1 Tax=Cryobacterium sp. TmT2-59 TaxID=1259264 RepID=UPI00106A3AA8|nr:hypothetical protein [Cryobacterium sp. TmT2-59]TFC89934.1 hypothetical protein E3T24_00205 [Cryobacterium sp. TmT2-59]
MTETASSGSLDAFWTLESVPFADEHKARLASFQSGDERFVWGVHRDTGEPWFLSEDTAHESRPFVKEYIVCPVPGPYVSG